MTEEWYESVHLSLNNEPSLEEVRATISRILKDKHFFSSPKRNLGIFHDLVAKTIPDLYDHFDQDTRALLIQLFTSLPGISNLILRIQYLSQSIDQETSELHKLTALPLTQILAHINILGSFLSEVLLKPSFIASLLSYEQDSQGHSQIVTFLSGSKVFNIASEARFLIDRRYSLLSSAIHSGPRSSGEIYDSWEWIVSRSSYIKRLGSWIVKLSAESERDRQVAAEMLIKTISLDSVPLFQTVINSGSVEYIKELVQKASSSERKQFTAKLLQYFQQEHLSDDQDNNVLNRRVTAVAAILSHFSPDLSTIAFLVKYSSSLSANLSARRVVVLLCKSNDKLFLETLKRWSDRTAIKHQPVILQQAETELLLVWLNCLSTAFIRSTSSSSLFLNGISNRLSSALETPRILGVIFAEAMSSKLDAKDKRLDFGLGDTVTEDIKEWKNHIMEINDQPISYKEECFDALGASPQSDKAERLESESTLPLSSTLTLSVSTTNGTPQTGSASKNPEPIRGFLVSESNHSTALSSSKIVEIHSDSDDEDEFQPYAMPEDDVEDSDDEVGLTKSKVSPPLYIKDLLSYLSSDEYEKQQLGLIHGPSLIRRKATFGQELNFHAKDLASVLAGLRDQFEIDNFLQLQLDCLVALISGSPEIVGPFLANLFITGDLSLQQRLTILSSLSLGARDIGGYTDSRANTQFPSKHLPEVIHQQFLQGAGDIMTRDSDKIALELQQNLLSPTVDEAKEHIIGGPKVVRISRRLENERSGVTTGTTIIKNHLGKFAYKSLFMPLISIWYRFDFHGIYSETLTSHYIKTLALILHAASPSRDQAEMTRELLNVLLSLRSSSDVLTQEAILTAVLVILDINEAEFLVSSFGRQIIEIRAWLEQSWQDINDERIRGMAAGVLYRINEITEKYQRRLIGHMMGLETDLNVGMTIPSMNELRLH